jgi:hypothetical protein
VKHHETYYQFVVLLKEHERIIVPKALPWLSGGNGAMPANKPQTEQEKIEDEAKGLLEELRERQAMGKGKTYEVTQSDIKNRLNELAARQEQLGGVKGGTALGDCRSGTFGDAAGAVVAPISGMLGKFGRGMLAKPVVQPKQAAPAAPASAPAPSKQGGGRIDAGPCAHLRKGSGSGPYRGGAHSETSKPRNNGKDSHHAPAKDASPLPPKDGPAIQMDPKDHAKTSINGQMAGSIEYREKIADLIAAGDWRKAMATEIRDIRKVAKNSGDPKKYNEAMREMLTYYKCLEKHGLPK